MAAKDSVRACPYCREEISAQATRCRFCGSAIVPDMPGHEGTCPHCLSEIDPKASVCRYCRSVVGPVGSGAFPASAPFVAPLGRPPVGQVFEVDRGGAMARDNAGGLSIDKVACGPCSGGQMTCMVLLCWDMDGRRMCVFTDGTYPCASGALRG
jgi:hypothetical protein